MLEFDQSITWLVEQRLDEIESPRQRTMLQTVLAHMKAEAAGDVDGLMATLVDDPQQRVGIDGRHEPEGLRRRAEVLRGLRREWAGDPADAHRAPGRRRRSSCPRRGHDHDRPVAGCTPARVAIPEDAGHYATTCAW
jgi:hypothetical protein